MRGDWQGRSFAAIMRSSSDRVGRLPRAPESFRFPHGESLVEQQRRVLEACATWSSPSASRSLVSHSGSLRLARAFAEGTGIDSFHEMSVPNGGVVELDTTGLAERIDRSLESEPSRDEA